MSISNLPVTSREYKVILNVDRFRDRGEGAEMFLRLIEFLIKKEGGSITEKQVKEEKRQTSYIDTTELAFHQHGFSLRLREEAKTPPEFQLNLKYRASDRYIAAAQDVSSVQAATIKFEEDVLPPFVSKFSHSNSIKFNVLPDLSRVSKVISLFPPLKELNIQADALVKTINDFNATEVVRKLCKFQFNDPLTIKASLSFWYLTKEEDGWPLIAEFSFDYDVEQQVEAGSLEKYPSQVVSGANRFFGALQTQAGWLNLNATTKTAFAIEVL